MATFGEKLNPYAKLVLRDTYKIDITKISKSEGVKTQLANVLNRVLPPKVNITVRKQLKKRPAPQNAWTIQQNQNNPGTINNLWDYLTKRFPEGSVDSEGNPNDYKTKPQYTGRYNRIRDRMRLRIRNRIRDRLVVKKGMSILITRTKKELTEQGIPLKGEIKKLKQDVRELSEKRSASTNSLSF